MVSATAVGAGLGFESWALCSRRLSELDVEGWAFAFGRFNVLTLHRFNAASALPVIANRLNRAAFHRFFAKALFLGAFRLFVDERVTTVIVAFEIGRSGFAAQIAVDALIIDVKFATYVFGVF